MARELAFTPTAWEDYLYWQAQDPRMLERLNLLLRECQRDPFRGIGKPEPLKGTSRDSGPDASTRPTASSTP